MTMDTTLTDKWLWAFAMVISYGLGILTCWGWGLV